MEHHYCREETVFSLQFQIEKLIWLAEKALVTAYRFTP